MLEFTESNRSINIREKHFDVLISSLGFESRSIYIANELKKNYTQGICFSFQDRKEISYQVNLNKYKSLNFIVENWIDSIECIDLGKFFTNLDVFKSIATTKQISLAIDVSSMTRSMSAKIVHTMINYFDLQNEYEIIILYAPAKFSKPKNEQSQIKIAGPVISEYSGWSIFPEQPTYAVLGLGYEYGKALGALDYLDVSDAMLYRPIGSNEKFVQVVNKVNDDLLQMVGTNKVIDYDVNDPYDTFVKLRSLVIGLQRNGRVILIPFGPKIFHVICLIVAEFLDSDISVWRISPGEKETPLNSTANGEIVSMIFNKRKI